ncbi:patatin-like phospholipase family protein [Mucilaginibacter sp. UYCu711]|uniref:patatin-like phospholipase family protein n=1 Tax=Mucilaginibacter sp. UYCu711 TaxID=3156339 RepID=UPI003D1A4117
MDKVGLVLSGGGARGIAHLGLLQGLDEMGIKVGVISGVSSGAIIGALYAAGYTPQHILALTKAHSATTIIGVILSAGGLFSPTGLRDVLTSTIPKGNFEHLSIPLFVTATDIVTGTAITFSKGPLYDALVGSSSIPALFDPIKSGDRYLVDGSVLNNLPVDCLSGQCDVIMGSHVNRLFHQQKEPLSRLQVFERCFQLAIAGTVAAHGKKCDVFIEPDLSSYNMFEMKYADEIFEVGYHTVNAHRQLIENILK